MTERQKITKKLDQLLHEIVVLLYPACVTCGSRDNPTTGHLISRGKKSVMYELTNIARQCSNCNSIHETNKKPFQDWFIKTYGGGAYVDLVIHADQDVRSIKTWQLQETYDQLLTIKKTLE